MEGDGAGEIVTGPGPDKRNRAVVRIFREDGTLLREFQAYPDGVRYGVRVSVGGVGEPLGGAGGPRGAGLRRGIRNGSAVP